jgi:leucyl aminopeptidase
VLCYDASGACCDARDDPGLRKAGQASNSRQAREDRLSIPTTKRRKISLLPPDAGPRIRGGEAQPSAAALKAFGAMILLQDPELPPGRKLPHANTWRALHARARPAHGEVRLASTGIDGRCAAALAYCRADASGFERLAIAGRALKAARTLGEPPLRVAVAAGARSAAVRAAMLEALCAAACSHGFDLPSMRASRAVGRRTVEVLHTGALDLRRTQVTTDAANLVRHLTALPPNVLDAAGYRRALASLARRHGLGLRWYGEAALRRAGAGAFLAVSRGSATRDAGIARLSWRPRGRSSATRPDVALVGKGIVFDTGGTNLKAHRGMVDMHTDMAGSAVALAVITALATLKYPRPVDAWLAITDNAIGPRAYRPQDVLVAANGVSIQVIHTDAEGRLVLADTLALAGATKPRLMIDYATLTGACVYALTERMSGAFANRPDLLEALSAAGAASGERVWPFPMDEDYDSDLDSSIADIAQCAVEGKGDHILAARFLRRFVPSDVAWAHLDLSSATRKGGLAHVPTEETGFGVRLTLSLLLDQKLELP